MKKREKTKLTQRSFWRFWQIHTIRTRLLVAFISVVLLTGFVIGTTSAYFNFLNTREQIFNQLEVAATLKESQVNSWINALQTELNGTLFETDPFSLTPSLLLASEEFSDSAREQTYGYLREQLKRLIARTGRFEEIFLLDRQGQIILSTDPAQEGKIQKNQAYFQEGLKSPYVQPPQYSPSLGQTSVIFTQPVVGEDGKTVGVLAGRASLTRLSDIMEARAGLGDTGETYLVALNQSLLTPSLFEGYTVGKTYVRTEGANLALKDHAKGYGLYNDYRDIPIVGVFHWLPQLQVALLAEQDQAEAFRSAYTTLGINISVSVVALLLAVIAGLLITRSIAIPLTSLAETARQIAGGNLKLTAPVERADEIGDLAQAFNSMTTQLRGLIDSLEERIDERTHALQTSAEISRQVVGILDPNQLLQSIVNLIQTEFKFYHTHIYLIDEGTDYLIMTEGSGEVGRQLKTQGHKLQLGQGIVGTVASSGKAFLVNNVDEVPNFIRNPLLSKTQSELAIPLRKGEKILGVLDIQSDELGAFSQADLTLMQSIADQVAIAVDNARLFRETQATIAEVEALNRRLTREIWQDIAHKVYTTGYVFNKLGLTPAPTDWIATMTEAVQQKQLVHQQSNGKTSNTHTLTSLAIPLSLRGEVIGVIGIERSVDKSWSEDELITIQTMAEQVALALDAARLARETERAAWRDRMVSESTAKVWSSSEIEDVMKAAVAQLGDKLRASEVVIRLGTEIELAQE